jgi:ketosteroid isomerase-like protein
MPNYTAEEQRNIDTVNRMFRSGEQRKEPFDVSSLFADDAVWWNGLPLIPGNVGETEHRGIESIRNILRGSGAAHPGTGIDSYDLTTNSYSDVVVIADGDWVVRQHTMQAKTLGGKDYRNVYCFVFRFNAEGKIAYLTEHWNTWNAFRLLFNNFDVDPAHPTST